MGYERWRVVDTGNSSVNWRNSVPKETLNTPGWKVLTTSLLYSSRVREGNTWAVVGHAEEHRQTRIRYYANKLDGNWHSKCTPGLDKIGERGPVVPRTIITMDNWLTDWPDTFCEKGGVLGKLLSSRTHRPNKKRTPVVFCGVSEQRENPTTGLTSLGLDTGRVVHRVVLYLCDWNGVEGKKKGNRG